jgi:small subunit ribosomal protein S6
MEQTKYLYETTFIVNASLEDAQIDAVTDHVLETITRNGGEIAATNKWGRKRLAYTIQKKNNGFYVNIEFTAPGGVIAQLERSFILEENILRFLTVQISERALKARSRALATQSAQVETISPEIPDTSPVKEPLFENEGTEPIVKPL